MKNNIKQLRNEMKISQKDLAESLNVSRQTINAIETGKFDPSLTLTIKITRFFNKSLEEIFIMEKQYK
jgi:putative transcriptional regulator